MAGMASLIVFLVVRQVLRLVLTRINYTGVI
jgi:hypothetical protein